VLGTCLQSRGLTSASFPPSYKAVNASRGLSLVMPLGLCSCLKARCVPYCHLSTLLCFLLPHTLLYLAFQHPFVSKVTSNRALRELVAEAKAEVLEEIEDSRDEAEDDDSSESASVSAPLPAPCHAWHRVGQQWVKSPQPGCRRLNPGFSPRCPMGEGCCLAGAPQVGGKAVL